MASLLDHPEMQPTLLDPDAVERFFADLAFETNVLAILIRGKEEERVGVVAPTLRDARDAFSSREATGVQIRYVHRGVEWSDTLMHTGAGSRLVRVKK